MLDFGLCLIVSSIIVSFSAIVCCSTISGKSLAQILSDFTAPRKSAEQKEQEED